MDKLRGLTDGVFGLNFASGLTGGGKKLKETEGKPPVLSDQVSLSIPHKKELVEDTTLYAQNKGIFQSSKAVFEEAKPDMDKVKPGETFSEKPVRPELLSKEVKLKSGVTITEDVKSNTVTISQNDGNGMPKTLAVLEDTSMHLPRQREDFPGNFLAAFGQPTSAKSGDLVLDNRDMREIIHDNGSITLEDKKRGVLEYPKALQTMGKLGASPTAMFNTLAGMALAAGAMAALSKWHGDTYTITPEGSVQGSQFDRGKFSFMSNNMSKDGAPTKVVVSSPFGDVEEKKVGGDKLPDGSIKVKRGDEDVYYKPFLSTNFVNTPSQ